MNLQMSVAQMVAVVLTGMVVVFSAILLLIFIIWLMGKYFTSRDEKRKQELAQAKATTPQPAVVKTTPKTEPVKPVAQSDDDEVVAVISAAVAMMSLADGKNYKVKSIKAVKSTTSGRPAWSMAGLRENTRPFRQR
jgi:sodium pump decarboxylase gamma subunit